MPPQHGYFRYADHQFNSVIAHDGSRPIHSKRLTERESGSFANFIDVSIVPVGADIGIHTHTMDNEEIYIVLSGRGLMYVDGQEFEVTDGDVIVNRPGGTHGLKNIGDVDLRLVVVEVAEPAPQG